MIARDDTGMLRAGLVQLQVRTNHDDESRARASRHVAAAAAAGCNLVVLPEAFATGLNLPRARELAEPVDGRTANWMREHAAAHGVHLVAGLLERDGDDVYTSVLLLDAHGEVLDVYRRTMIYDLERHFIDAGHGSRVTATDAGRIGLVAGYDIQFPEVTRRLFAERVEVLVCPALLLRPFRESVRQMMRARAAENCCFVLFCSATGENTLAGLTYMGGSEIVQSPVGIARYSREFRRQPQVLASADRDEELLVADLDLAALRRLQEANPLAKDFARSSLAPALAGIAAGGDR